MYCTVSSFETTFLAALLNQPSPPPDLAPASQHHPACPRPLPAAPFPPYDCHPSESSYVRRNDTDHPSGGRLCSLFVGAADLPEMSGVVNFLAELGPSSRLAISRYPSHSSECPSTGLARWRQEEVHRWLHLQLGPTPIAARS